MPEYEEKAPVEAPEPDPELLEAAAEADENAPTDDSRPDGTQLPHPDANPNLVEEGDAGVGEVELDSSVYEEGED